MSTSTLHLGIFYMPQICDMGPMALLPLWRKACWGFFHPEKSWRLRPGLNPQTWVLKRHSECLPALCSPHQENATKCCFPVTLPGHNTGAHHWNQHEISGRQVLPLATYGPNLTSSDFHMSDPLQYTITKVTRHWRMLCVSPVVA